MRERITNLFQKTENFVLTTAFKFWVWLVVKLDVAISVELPEQQPWVIERDVTDAGIVAERDELKLSRAIVQYENLMLKDEVEALQARIQSYLPYLKQAVDNRPKLTPREVAEIREMKRSGVSQAGIAEIYDVNPATVSRIVRGQYYKTAAA